MDLTIINFPTEAEREALERLRRLIYLDINAGEA